MKIQEKSIKDDLNNLIRWFGHKHYDKAYEIYKSLYQTGQPAFIQIKKTLINLDWKEIDIPLEVATVSVLMNLLYDIDESNARDVLSSIKYSDSSDAIKSIIDSICSFSKSDFKLYEICNIEIYESKNINTKNNIKKMIDIWLRKIPNDQIQDINRIYIVRQKDLSVWGTYFPFLNIVTLVWDNEYSRYNPIGWMSLPKIEFVFYHEIGHHILNHRGQNIEQEKNADKFALKMMYQTKPKPYLKIVLFNVMYFLFKPYIKKYCSK